MEDLTYLDAHFYFDVDGTLIKLAVKGLSHWDKEMDNKCAEDIKKDVANLCNAEVSKVRRISRKEYEELNSEEDDIDEEGYDF